MAGIDGYTSSMLSCPLTSEFGGSIWETTLAAEQHDACFGALAGAGPGAQHGAWAGRGAPGVAAAVAYGARVTSAARAGARQEAR